MPNVNSLPSKNMQYTWVITNHKSDFPTRLGERTFCIVEDIVN